MIKSQDKIKAEMLSEVKGAENFDDMIGKIVTYIRLNYDEKGIEAEIVEDDNDLIEI